MNIKQKIQQIYLKKKGNIIYLLYMHTNMGGNRNYEINLIKRKNIKNV